ncbi:MAG: DUF1579 family protein [Planctomycetota bacterium]|nr:DUF1579 family protein [Planctomycetota bacterium]
MRIVTLCIPFLVSACVASEPARAPRRSNVAVNVEQIEDQAREAASGSRPRKEHRALEALTGSWKTTVVTVGADNDEGDPRPGSARIESTLGGRYLKWDATLDLSGETHATTGFLGFDVNQGEYQLLMISDLATGMGVARGRGDLQAKGVRFVIEIADPESGALRRAISVLRVVNPDRFELEQVGADPDGRERVVRRTHYERVKK